MAEEISNIEEKESKEGLQQLLDSTYPLLQKFREACPGTYKHSQSVASMIEGVAIALGLDVNRLKVMALYHDIGKMFNPKYFTENQLEDENLHQDLDPKISYQIITRHVSDSVIILLNEPDFPRDIIEMISQHHGQTVLKYFYKNSEGCEPDEFRYKTTRPKSVESAVLMIVDQIEATSRSLIQANKFDAVTVIDNTINDLINDNQLDDVTMKLGDLKKMKEAIGKELEGSFQKRVEYPDEKKKTTNKTENN